MQRLESFDERIVFRETSVSQQVETSTVKHMKETKTETVSEQEAETDGVFAKVLRIKETLTITKQETVIEVIEMKSFKKIVSLFGSTLSDSIDMVSFNILTVEEITEVRSSLKTRSVLKTVERCYDEVCYNYSVLNEKANRMGRSTLLIDFLDTIDIEVIRGKKLKGEELSEAIKSASPKKKLRASDLSEKTRKEAIEHGESQVEIIEESESTRFKKQKTAPFEEGKTGEAVISQEIVSSVKVVEETTTKEEPKQIPPKKPIQKKRSNAEETTSIQETTDEMKKKAAMKKKTLPTQKNPDKSDKPKEEAQEAAEEKKEDIDKDNKKSFPKKKTLPTRKSPEKDNKPQEEPTVKVEEAKEVTEKKEKKKVIKKKIVKKKEIISEEPTLKQTSAFVSGGGGGYGGGMIGVSTTHHCLSEKCVVCKGLPVRPHVCTSCNRQYCTMCTYELPNSSKCTDCQGRLISMNQNNTSTAFEATFTKFSPQKVDKQPPQQQQDKVKDFFEMNKDRYVNKLWQNEDIIQTSDKDAKPMKKLRRKIEVTTMHIDEDTIDWRKYYHIKEYAFGLNVEKKFNLNQNDSIWSLCYVPEVSTGIDGILTGHSSGAIHLWNIDKQIKTKTFSEHTAKVYDIKLLPNKANVFKVNFISVGEDRFTKVWDLTSINCLLSISNLSPIYCLEVLSHNSFLIGDKNQQMIYHQVTPNQTGFQKSFSSFSKVDHCSYIWRVLHLKLIKASTLIVSASETNLFLHEISADNKVFTPIREFNSTKALIHSLTELTQAKFASTAVDHSIRIWDYQQETCLQIIDGFYDSTVFSLIYLNDYISSIPKASNVFIVGGYDKKMKLIGEDLNTSSTFEYSHYDRPESLYKMAFLSNNAKYKVASINFGCSSSLYIWGINSID